MKINIIDEIRLLFCGLLFNVILWLAPHNEEGTLIVLTIRDWAKKASGIVAKQLNGIRK